MFFCISLLAHGQVVSGIVTSADSGKPTIGATVKVKGGPVVAITNARGNYSINVAPTGTLIFSFMGYNTIEVPVAGRTTVNVTLQLATVDVEAVVVTGYSTRSQRATGYSATVMRGEDISGAKNPSLMGGVQGRVAGITVSQVGGTGTSTKVLIRGISSLSNNQPLYVIDGIPVSNGNFGTLAANALNNAVNFGNQANDLNSDDIESMTILKGASATALYGSRAANGVIVITTKRAKGGTFAITYNSTVMASVISRTPQTQDMFGEGWPDWDPMENGSWGPRLDGRMHEWGAWAGHTEADGKPVGWVTLEKPFSYVKNNIRNFYRTGVETTNTLSTAISNDNAALAVSYSNVTSNGILYYDAEKYEKNNLSLRANGAYNNFTVDGSMNYVRVDQRRPNAAQGSLYPYSLQYASDISWKAVRDINSIYNNFDNYYTLYAQNPYQMMNDNNNKFQSDRIFTKFEVGYQILEGLKATARFGGDFSNARIFRWTERHDLVDGTWTKEGGKAAVPGNYSERYQNANELDFTTMLNANYKVMDNNLSLGGFLGANANQRKDGYLETSVASLDSPGYHSLFNGTPAADTYVSNRRLMSVLGQFDMGWKDFWYFSASARNDWSSTLPKSNNSYFYWGVNTTFVFTDAFTQLKEGVMDLLKLRLAYGKTGNDTDPYRTGSVFVPVRVTLPFGRMDMPFDNTPGLTKSNTLGNNDLRPEITTESEVGISANFFDNRLRFDGTFYNKVTKDQIILATLAPETGYTQRAMNIGKIRNRGIEILIGGDIIRQQDFLWSATWTFTKNVSKVMKLYDDLDVYPVYSFTGGARFALEIGQPVGIFSIPAAQTVKDGEYKGYTIVNANGLPTTSASDVKRIGSSAPDFTTGLSTSISYKNLSLGITMDWRKGGYFYSNTAATLYFTGNATQTMYNERAPFIVPHSVKSVGGVYVENDIPLRMSTTTIGSYWYASNTPVNTDLIILPKDFVKVREIILTYNFPQKWSKVIGVKDASFSLIARNPFMWTPAKNNFVDPEISNYGNDLISEFGEYSGAPSVSTFGASLRVTF